MSANTTIHTGFWVNYSKGDVLGATLTLKKTNAAFLIAALAIFIQLIGLQSWGIMRFIMHQIRTTREARDGLFHQQQATLRNDNSDISTIWFFSRLAFAWRSRSSKTFRKSVPIILVAFLHLIAFIAASILASRITTTDEQVLVARDTYCGPWGGFNGSVVYDVEILNEFQAYTYTTVQSTQKYVESCLTSPQSLPECTMFINPRVNWTSTMKNTCPFGDLCLGPSLYLDTGLIDSRNDLGINSRDSERVQWRHNLTCSPISTDGYSKNGTSTVNYKNHFDNGKMDFNYTALYYGPTAQKRSLSGVDDPVIANATYIYTNFHESSKLSSSNSVLLPYYLLAMVVDEDANANFDPIPVLDVGNATVILAFASPEVAYTAPSDDLWLSAHAEGEKSIYNAFDAALHNLTVFFPDERVSVLACLEQHQLCNPASQDESCTPFRSMYHHFPDEELQAVFNNTHQMAAANNILSSILALDYYVDQTTLLAESFAAYGLSLPLSPNQWILEVENWFTIGLAVTQRFMLEIITGPASAQYSNHVNQTVAATDHDFAWTCENQIINRGDFTNFRTLTISLIFALGIIVYVTNQSLEFITGAVRDRYTSGRWKQQAWWAEGTLQLQRRTFERIGVKWDSDDWDLIPVTEKGITFSASRNWDEKQPLYPEEENSSSKTSQNSSEPKNVAVQTTETEVEEEPEGIQRSNSALTFVNSRGVQRTDTAKENAIVQVDSCTTFDSEESGESSHGDGESRRSV